MNLILFWISGRFINIKQNFTWYLFLSIRAIHSVLIQHHHRRQIGRTNVMKTPNMKSMMNILKDVNFWHLKNLKWTLTKWTNHVLPDLWEEYRFEWYYFLLSRKWHILSNFLNKFLFFDVCQQFWIPLSFCVPYFYYSFCFEFQLFLLRYHSILVNQISITSS